MPCRDYEWDDQKEIQRQREHVDMLARIACKALAELERQGTADFLLIQDKEVRDWWTRHKAADEAAKANGSYDD